MKRLIPAALAIALPSVAAANGRIPTSVGMTYRADQDPILAAMTFGLLESTDGGRSYTWACEQAIGITGDWDPQYVYYPGGKILATTPTKGVTISNDGGCTFTPAGDPVAGKSAWRMTLSPDGTTVIVSTNSTAKRNAVYLSTDGATFRESAIFSDTRIFDWVEPVLSDPMRIYAGSLSMQFDDPQLHVTKDGGRTATSFTIPEHDAHQIQILGANMATPDTVYVRLRVGAGGKLYKTTDGGTTWAVIFEGTITAAAFDPPNDTLYVSGVRAGAGGAGGTGEVGGVLRSTDGGATWQLGATDPRPRCFGFDAARNLYACTFNYGNALMARSTDRGNSFSPFLSVEPAMLKGPKCCPAGTPVHDMCEPLWAGLADQLGLGQGSRVSCGGGGAGGAGAGGMSGGGGVSGGGGNAGSGGRGGSGNGGTAGSGGGGSSGGGGCATSGGGSTGALTPLLALFGLFALPRRRR